MRRTRDPARPPRPAAPAADRRGHPAPLAADQLRRILDELDVGVVLCDRGYRRVLFANDEGAHAVSMLGGSAARVPAELGAALDGARADGAPPGSAYTRAVEVTAPNRQRYFVRAKRVPAPLDGALLVITRACLRLMDCVDLLHRRLGLSHRQAECVALIRRGMTNKEIAAHLGLSEGTIEQYLVRIFARLGVSRRSDLVALADEQIVADEPIEVEP
ncbi:MAG TPA: helix-turn-helix transcriptional regulator [Polyangia bacterium]